MKTINFFQSIEKAFSCVEQKLNDSVEYYEYRERYNELDVLTKRGTYCRVNMATFDVKVIMLNVEP